MKKLSIVLLTFILTITFTGCSNKNNNEQYEEAMKEGKSNVIEEEYKKAIDYFELALEYKKEDSEATNLIKQLNLLLDIQKPETKIDYFYQIKQIEKINKIETETNVVKNKANEYKDVVIENIDSLIKHIEEEIENGNYKNVQDDLKDTIKECKNIKSLKKQLDKCNKLLEICTEKEKKSEKEQNQDVSNSEESGQNKSPNSNKVYCSSGNHYVDSQNYNSDAKCCYGCEQEAYLKSASCNLPCDYCGDETGLERTVSLYTGKCYKCGRKIFPAVQKIYEDGTVIYEDGSKSHY